MGPRSLLFQTLHVTCNLCFVAMFGFAVATVGGDGLTAGVVAVGGGGGGAC